MAEEILQPKDITIQLLQQLFDAAFMETGIDDDGDLFVRGGRFRCWVLPKNDGEIIRLMSIFGVQDNASRAELLEFVNRANREYLYVQVSSDLESRVVFNSYLPVVGGTTKKNIVLGAKIHHRVMEGMVSEPYARGVLS